MAFARNVRSIRQPLGGALRGFNCYELWCREHPSGAEYQENVAAVRESLHAMDAGRMRPFSTFDADFRTRHGIMGGNGITSGK